MEYMWIVGLLGLLLLIGILTNIRFGRRNKAVLKVSETADLHLRGHTVKIKLKAVGHDLWIYYNHRYITDANLPGRDDDRKVFVGSTEKVYLSNGKVNLLITNLGDERVEFELIPSR